MKIEPKFYKRVFVWSGPLRLFHWVFAISIAVLILTGLNIHNPIATTSSEFRPSFLMAMIRYFHFVAAYFFISAFILRVYLLFFGNKYERITNFLPINRENALSFWQTLKFYLYLTDEHELRVGHTVLAGVVYTLLFLASLVMILTGLYLLYPEVGIIKKLGGMLFGTPQTARFIHYFLHWAFIFFILVHLYIAIWHELRAPEAIISGMFSGTKFLPAEVVEKETKPKEPSCT
jgi:Ni/Fe-hydrogenase 1 B-type cytochrome subunit